MTLYQCADVVINGAAGWLAGHVIAGGRSKPVDRMIAVLFFLGVLARVVALYC